MNEAPYLPCVFLLGWPYSTVARRICISCCETEGRAQKMMDRLLTQLEEEWDQHHAGIILIHGIMQSCEGERMHSDREGITAGREGGKKRKKRCTACRGTLLWFLTWWLTHVYYRILMTRPITSHNPFYRTAGIKTAWKSFTISFRAASFEENLKTHNTRGSGDGNAHSTSHNL